MANYTTGADLLAATLTVCGELTDGTSNYSDDALTYLNIAYKGLLTGGNIYGIDVADPWSWAISRRPILMTLQPAITTVSVSVTQQSFNITFGTSPKDVYGNNISVKGWWISAINSRDEWFLITQHTSGSSTAQIDMPYTEATASAATCRLTQLDYDLVDNSVTVDQYNCKIDFTEGAGALVATLTQGIYSPADYATMVNAALHSAGALTYTGSFDSTTRLFTWRSSGTFHILGATGANVAYSATETMGLDCLDYTTASSYTAVYPLNAITRLTSPCLVYRPPNTPWRNPKSEGKIYELSYNSFVRLYPFSMMTSGVPDKFCVVKTAANGVVSVRFNGFMDGSSALPTRVDFGYIPKYRALQNNAVSVPVVPEEHRKYLVDAAAGMLLHDKTDSKRVEREQLAKAGLQALQHSNRKDMSLAGVNYGKLVPRYGMTQKRWWWQIT